MGIRVGAWLELGILGAQPKVKNEKEFFFSVCVVNLSLQSEVGLPLLFFSLLCTHFWEGFYLLRFWIGPSKKSVFLNKRESVCFFFFVSAGNLFPQSEVSLLSLYAHFWE